MTARRLRLLTLVLAVVVVAGLGVLGVRLATQTEGGPGERVQQLFSGREPAAQAAATDDARTRELVMSRANQFVLRTNTYGPSDLDEQNALPGYADGVRELMTAKLAAGFEENLTLAEQSVAQAGYARTAQLYATGLESLEGDRASVLVTGAVSGSYPDPEQDGRIEDEPLQFRYQLSLVRTEGEWLVDSFTPVQGVEDQAQPTTPADPGASPGTTEPPAGSTGGDPAGGKAGRR
ncbi:hypothetical protein [Nocardioides dongxiaopingii]|uniref:hypothetical protein n=1 Tax=Nocardioides dongxiaopingii TaxID=2576036 RepID=UPI0010C76BFB|nr:hypothetical protein [Nocardioides dongxiaopingii]